MYRATSPDGVSTTWATREIAALDFLLGIPLEAERSIVRAGISGDDRRRRENREFAGVAGAFSSDDEEDASRIGFSRHSSDSVRIGGTGEVTVARRHRGGEREESERRGGGRAGDEETTTTATVTVPATPTRWWEKLLRGEADPKAERAAQRRLKETQELERPDEGEGATAEGGAVDVSGDATAVATIMAKKPETHGASMIRAGGPAAPRAPGRRLEGRDDAVVVRIPRDVLTVESMTSHRGLARQAAVREWEMRTAHGIDTKSSRANNRRTSLEVGGGIGTIAEDEELGGDGSAANRGLLDGRAFFSSCGSYPVAVFSVIKYDPKSEEAARRRKKLEDMGGGGTQMSCMPVRDWRGISYKALLPRIERKNKSFNRFLRKNRRAVAAKRRREARNTIGNRDHNRKDILAGDTSENTSKTHTDDDGSGVSHSTTSHTGAATDDEDDASVSSTSSEESDSYVPGFLDDPEMVQGRHRHVMIGDQTTGPIVCSTIQFVQPADLKADLNRQFKERFDGWEPPKAQRKYIGARIVDGVYSPYDPTEEGTDGGADLLDSNHGHGSDGTLGPHRRTRSSSDVGAAATIRMPPSLTLSKIRSVKQQALVACVKANIEISTVALACIYFERLCLDCRVDKTNRRLSFAACLLLSAKINEANVAIVHDQGSKDRDDRGSNGEKESSGKKKSGVLRSWIRPTKKSRNITEALFEFFTHDWSLSLKHLFAAEWVVFTALGFQVHATPYQVAFHFKRLMKVLEWNPLAYLGREMYDQWQACLDDEAARKEFHERRKEMRRKQKERKLLRLQRELHQQQAAEEAAQAAAMRASSTSARLLGSDKPVANRQHSELSIPSDTSDGVAVNASHAITKTSEGAEDSQPLVTAQIRQIPSTGQLSLLPKNAPSAFQKKERRNSGGHASAKMSVWNRFVLKKQLSSASEKAPVVKENGQLEYSLYDRLGNSTHAAPLLHSGNNPIKRVRSSPGIDELADRTDEVVGAHQNVIIDMSGAGYDMFLEDTHRDDATV